jgi:tetratricopeptide (TPR) repeat protein
VRELVAVLTDPVRPGFVRVTGFITLAHMDLAHGRRADAARMLDSASALDPAQGLEYRSLLALAPFLTSERRALEAQRAALLRFAAGAVPPSDLPNGFFNVLNGLHPALRSYLLGLTEARLGAAAQANAHADALERAAMPEDLARLMTRPLARSVRAAVLESQGEGRAREAYDALGAMDVHYEPGLFSAFYSRAQERWRRAVLLEAAGRPDEARRWFRSFRHFSVFDRIYEAPADYRLGLLAERQGDVAEARARYANVVRLWSECDAEFRPTLEDARARLARLERP